MKKLFGILICLIATYNSYAQPWATMVQDYTPGKAGSFSGGIYSAAGKIFFTNSHDGQGHWDPYMFDGHHFSKLAELSNFSNPQNYTAYNGKVYFIVTDGADNGLWVSDGTPAGTNRILDIDIDYSSVGQAFNIVVLNGKMYFMQQQYTNNGSASSLWISDGTAMGTNKVTDIVISSNHSAADVYGLEIVSNKMRFRVEYSDVWVSDGSAIGTYKVQHDWEDPQISYNSTGYFLRYDITGIGLYNSDGSNQGTTLVKQLYTGDMSPWVGYRDYMGVLNGKLIFPVINDQNVSQLWISDGTSTGTQKVFQCSADTMLSGFVYQVAGNKFFFSLKYKPQDSAYAHYYLAVTDGTSAGTRFVNKDFELGIDPIGYYPSYIYNGKLFYPHMVQGSGGGVYCDALYYSDGTNVGTGKVGGGATIPSYAAQTFDTLNGELYFTGADYIHGVELWRLFDLPLNVTTAAANNTQVLYPNPATNSFSVQIDNTNNTTVKIFSLTGQLLLQTTQTQNISIAQIPAGIYMVQAIADGKMHTEKLVKE